MSNLFVTTGRLYLRSITETDEDAIYGYRSLEDVARFQYWEPFGREQIKLFISRNKDVIPLTPEKWLGFVIVLKASGKVIGDCAACIKKTSRKENKSAPAFSLEIGCNVSPAYQNQGFAREALAGLIAYYTTHATIKEVCGITDAENAASARLMQLLGMTRVEGFERRIMCKGKVCVEHKYKKIII